MIACYNKCWTTFQFIAGKNLFGDNKKLCLIHLKYEKRKRLNLNKFVIMSSPFDKERVKIKSQDRKEIHAFS